MWGGLGCGFLWWRSAEREESSGGVLLGGRDFGCRWKFRSVAVATGNGRWWPVSAEQSWRLDFVELFQVVLSLLFVDDRVVAFGLMRCSSSGTQRF